MPVVEAPEHPVEASVAVDPKTTALIVVDMQNDFVKPGGALVVPTAAQTIPAIQLLRALARSHGMAVFYTQDTHEPGDIEFPIWGQHVLRGSWGWRIVDELAPEAGERVIEKLRYDGFFGTPLASMLTYLGVDTLVVTGMVTSGCVRATVIDAFSHNYRVVVPIECVADRSATSHQVNLFDMDMKYADVLPLADVLAHFGRR